MRIRSTCGPRVFRVFFVNVVEETKVYEEGNCIIVQGADEEDIVKAADALIMHWLGRIRA